MKHPREYYINRMNILGKIFFYLGVFRAYADGDVTSVVWRWYHPITWITWPIVLVICGFVGESILEVMNFKLPKYWQDKKVQWL